MPRGTLLSQEQKEQIYYAYYDLNYGIKEVSDFYNVCTATVFNISKEMNMPSKRSTEYEKVKRTAEETRKHIYEEYKNLGVKYPATFCKKSGMKINALVLSDIISEFDVEEKEVQNDIVVEEPVVTEEPKIKADDIKRVSTDNHVYCTFFMDRHDFPTFVTKSIYTTKSLDSYKMFDMEYLYKKSVEFIESNITFDADGKAESDIVIYMSGLQTVTGAIVKACMDCKVNLTFMHYNKDSDEWFRQEVIDCYKTNNTLLAQLVDRLLSVPDYSKYKYDDLFICGNVDMTKPFYIVKISYCDENDNVYNSQGYICEDGWNRFGEFGEQMLSVPIRTKTMLIQVLRDDAGFKFRGPIAHSFNSQRIVKED